MSEISEVTDQVKLDALKSRAAMLGISHSPNIGIDKLRQRIAEHLAAQEDEEDEGDEDAKPTSSPAERKTAEQRRIDNLIEAEKRANKLTRVIVSANDPMMQQRDGVYITVGNAVFPTTGFMIPFEVPWLIPEIVLHQLRNAEYQHYRKKKRRDPRMSRAEQEVEGVWRKAYNIEVLDMITEEEIEAIHQRQLADRAED